MQYSDNDIVCSLPISTEKTKRHLFLKVQYDAAVLVVSVVCSYHSLSSVTPLHHPSNFAVRPRMLMNCGQGWHPKQDADHRERKRRRTGFAALGASLQLFNDPKENHLFCPLLNLPHQIYLTVSPFIYRSSCSSHYGVTFCPAGQVATIQPPLSGTKPTVYHKHLSPTCNSNSNKVGSLSVLCATFASSHK